MIFPPFLDFLSYNYVYRATALCMNIKKGKVMALVNECLLMDHQ